jgi:hypothetical protein
MFVCDHRYRRFHTLEGPVELVCKLNRCTDRGCPGHSHTKSPERESYSLSAQLADMELNVVAGYVKSNDIVYAGSLVQYNTLANPILGLDSGGFITIGNLLAAANAALATSGLPLGSGFWQAYEQALAQVLQAANGNSTFVQQAVPGGP